jgi:hypothetical protein
MWYPANDLREAIKVLPKMLLFNIEISYLKDNQPIEKEKF